MQHFSEELKNWIKGYYQRHFGISLTDEQAEQGLHDFAGLYDAMVDLVNQELQEDADREANGWDEVPPSADC